MVYLDGEEFLPNWLETLTTGLPKTSVMLCSKTNETEFLIRAMQMGVREFLPLPLTPDGLEGALERVRAVTKKPRTFVASDTFLGMQSLGCPVFDAHGRVVGLSVVRRAPRTQAGSGGLRVVDVTDPLQPLAADRQREALDALARHVLAADSFAISPALARTRPTIM